MSNGIGTESRVSPLDREQVAHVEVGHTTIAPGLARMMVVVFLVVLALLPLFEAAARMWGPANRQAPPAGAGGAGGAPVVTAPADPRMSSDREPRTVVAAWRELVAANRVLLAWMNAFETRLEDESAIGRALRPPTQHALSQWLGAGNERVYVGRDGWLFYRPDVEYVTGRGFLDPREQTRRVAAAHEYERPPQPDPRPAILQFHRELAARGIRLIVMPTPVKPTVHPDRLSPTAAPLANGGLQNASYATFVAELRRAGVIVFDPTDLIAPDGDYLATDTHWRPETMERVAAALAGVVSEHVAPRTADAAVRYAAQRREARQRGDTAAMLDLPEEQALYPPERVALRFITDAAGDPWRASRDANVLLLGDSFTNIYSLASMGWGEAAGLAEQLSYVLQQPLDRIVQNDDGASATRVLLSRDPERLAGKDVVIWQFAARELAFGDWQMLELP